MSIKSSNFAKKHYNKCIHDNALMLQIYLSVISYNCLREYINVANTALFRCTN